MEEFSKETPNYRSNNVFARLSEPHLSLSRAADYRNSTAQLYRPAKNIIPRRLGVLYQPALDSVTSRQPPHLRPARLYPTFCRL